MVVNKNKRRTDMPSNRGRRTVGRISTADTPVEVDTSQVTQGPPVLNMEEVTIEYDNSILHDCDHYTFVAKLTGSTDESGERVTTSIGRICIKKKTWWFTEIKHILIMEQYKRKGLAKHLINYVLNEAEQPDSGEQMTRTAVVGATVNATNAPAISLLIGLGFSTGVSFRNTETGNDITIMMKSLSPVTQS
jgi:GNAT superfamily N-acetyltransferase